MYLFFCLDSKGYMSMWKNYAEKQQIDCYRSRWWLPLGDVEEDANQWAHKRL